MLLILYVPSAYLVEDAPQDKVEVIQHYKKILDEVLNGTKGVVLLPSDTDENGNLLFKLEVHSTKTDNYIIKASK